jgi:hypothetical protein
MAHTKEKKDKSQKKEKVEKKEHKSEKAQKASALAAAEKLDPTISNLFANSVCVASESLPQNCRILTTLVRCRQTYLYRDSYPICQIRQEGKVRRRRRGR